MRLQPIHIAIILTFAATAYLAWSGDQAVFADKGRLKVERIDGGDTVVLSWRSEIDVPMARRFEEAYEEWKGDAKRFVINLHSPGGSLSQGGDVIDVINRMKRTHRVDTLVGPRRACLSMCVPIFLQGESRIAAPDSRWMFHEPSAHNIFNGAPVKEFEFDRRFAADRFFRQYFGNSAMDPEWRAMLEREWRGKEVWKTGEELVDERSNIVTELM